MTQYLMSVFGPAEYEEYGNYPSEEAMKQAGRHRRLQPAIADDPPPGAAAGRSGGVGAEEEAACCLAAVRVPRPRPLLADQRLPVPARRRPGGGRS